MKSRKQIGSVLKTVLVVLVWHFAVLAGGALLISTGFLKDTYLYYWLLDRNLWALVFGISLLLAIFRKVRAVCILSVAHLLGLILGTLFGPNPAGREFGFGHYGWAWWLFIMLAAGVFGIVSEWIFSRKNGK